MGSPRAPLVLGWREEAAFPDWGLARVKVKLDTGARTSAVHARRVIEVGRHGRDGQSLPVLELELPLDREPDGASTLVRAASLGIRTVRDTRDRPEERHVIATRLVLGPVEKEIHISVTDRAGMLFRVLLGRTALAGDVVVDPARSYTLRDEGAHPRGRRSPRSTPSSRASAPPSPSSASPWCASSR